VVVEGVRELIMDRLRLVELIEAQKAQLSPEAKELWEELDILVNTTELDATSWAEQEDIIRRMQAFSKTDRHIRRVLYPLLTGLYVADEAEERGESGEKVRIRYTITAARGRDADEGRMAASYRTLDEALARLEEPYY
jgi:hypothetical protein